MARNFRFVIENLPRGAARRWIRSGLTVMLCLLPVFPVHAGDADKAANIATSVCARCHGADGNSTDPKIPKLAGRHPDYMVREMKAFGANARKCEDVIRIAGELGAGELKALGEYFGAQKSTRGKVADPAAADIGMKLYRDGDEDKGVPACAGCHGADAAGDKRFPRLAGQHKEYLLEQMHGFRNDVRNYAAARLMREVAKRMSEDQINAVAEYLTGL